MEERTYKYEIKKEYDQYSRMDGSTGNRTLILERDRYKSSHFVEVDLELEKIVKSIKDRYVEEMEGRGLDVTKEQIYFAEETARVILGTPKKQGSICINTASCGFGKSTIRDCILEWLQAEIMANNSTDGVIVTADRKEDLKKLENKLLKASGGKRFCYVMEGYSDEICINSDVKKHTDGCCQGCQYMGCKVKKQKSESKNFPILLMTNARLSCLNDKFDNYATWGDNFSRTRLLIDERVDINATINIDVALLNKIETYINNEMEYYLYNEEEEPTADNNNNGNKKKRRKKRKKVQDDEIRFNDKDKTQLVTLYKELSDAVKSILNKNRDKCTECRRKFINIKNDGELTSNDILFHELWFKYNLDYKFQNELQAIEEILRTGGVYVNEGKKEFITIPKTRNLAHNLSSFQTMIFDGSALIDIWYNSIDADFLYIKNTRTFENLKIVVHDAHKLTISDFKNENKQTKLIKSCNRYIDNLDIDNNWYLVTFLDYCKDLKVNDAKKQHFALDYEYTTENIEVDGHKVKQLVKENKLYHFGATKGRNIITPGANMCNSMVQFGYNIKPDYVTAIEFLAVTNGSDNKLINSLNSSEVISDIISADIGKTFRDLEDLSKVSYADRNIVYGDKSHPKHGSIKYRFGNSKLNEFEWLQIACELYQEINRTIIRQQDYVGQVEVHLFRINHTIIEILAELFPKCQIVYDKDKIQEFSLESKLNRKSPKKDNTDTAFQKIWNCLQNLPKGIHKTKDIKAMAKVSKNDFDAVSKDCDIKNWLDTHRISRGKYEVK